MQQPEINWKGFFISFLSGSLGIIAYSILSYKEEFPISLLHGILNFL